MSTRGARLRAFASSPAFSVAPSIAGQAQVGQTLVGNDGTFVRGSVTARQWKRGVAAIPGATGATYVCQAADVGAAISLAVTVTNGLNAANSRTATSAPTAAVVA